jgi:hypothetical protein
MDKTIPVSLDASCLLPPALLAVSAICNNHGFRSGMVTLNRKDPQRLLPSPSPSPSPRPSPAFINGARLSFTAPFDRVHAIAEQTTAPCGLAPRQVLRSLTDAGHNHQRSIVARRSGAALKLIPGSFGLADARRQLADGTFQAIKSSWTDNFCNYCPRIRSCFHGHGTGRYLSAA